MCICMYANIENIDGTYTILTIYATQNKKETTAVAAKT